MIPNMLMSVCMYYVPQQGLIPQRHSLGSSTLEFMENSPLPEDRTAQEEAPPKIDSHIFAPQLQGASMCQGSSSPAAPAHDHATAEELFGGSQSFERKELQSLAQTVAAQGQAIAALERTIAELRRELIQLKQVQVGATPRNVGPAPVLTATATDTTAFRAPIGSINMWGSHVRGTTAAQTRIPAPCSSPSRAAARNLIDFSPR
jgi:hypothetical protein